MTNLHIKKKERGHREGAGLMPKFLFVFMAMVGAILIWVLKHYEVSPFIVVLVPVSFILTYCGLAWRTTMFYIREDQIGDNAYYLGFLYTLSSLAYALLRFQLHQGGDPTDIIGSFGVALWSTILGIALRVFFSQLRHDPNEIEKEARIKIAQTASILASDLNQAAATFNSYTRGLQQSVDEAFLHAQSLSEKNITALEDLYKQISETETPNTLINRHLKDVFGEFEDAVRSLSSSARTQFQSVETLAKASDLFAKEVTDLHGHITLIKQSAATLHEGISGAEQVTQASQRIETSLNGLADSLSELSSVQAEVVQSVSNHADEIERQLERSRKYTEQTHESLVSMTNTLTEKLR